MTYRHAACNGTNMKGRKEYIEMKWQRITLLVHHGNTSMSIGDVSFYIIMHFTSGKHLHDHIIH